MVGDERIGQKRCSMRSTTVIMYKSLSSDLFGSRENCHLENALLMNSIVTAHGLLFSISSKGSFICIIQDRQDNTYHDLCNTSRGALAGTRNSSMGRPWRIDPTTHRTMSECSYHGATSRSVVVE